MSASLKTLKIATKGSNPADIPWIAFGCASGKTELPPDKGVKLAIETGLTHVDTAHIYGEGKNEELVGKGLKDAGLSRDSVYITTKIATLAPGETARELLTAALKKLGVEYVDLYLIHSAIPFLDREGGLPALWKEFEQLQRDGLTKNIGVSNFNADNLQSILETAEIVPAVHQLEIHPYLYKRPYTELLELHKKHGILVASYGPIRAHLKNPDGPLKQPLANAAKRLSAAHGKPVSETQALIKWLEAKDIIPVIASTKKERLQEFVEVQNLPALTPEEIETIETQGEKFVYRIYNHVRFQAHMDLHLKK